MNKDTLSIMTMGVWASDFQSRLCSPRDDSPSCVVCLDIEALSPVTSIAEVTHFCASAILLRSLSCNVGKCLIPHPELIFPLKHLHFFLDASWGISSYVKHTGGYSFRKPQLECRIGIPQNDNLYGTFDAAFSDKTITNFSWVVFPDTWFWYIKSYMTEQFSYHLKVLTPDSDNDIPITANWTAFYPDIMFGFISHHVSSRSVECNYKHPINNYI